MKKWFLLLFLSVLLFTSCSSSLFSGELKTNGLLNNNAGDIDKLLENGNASFSRNENLFETDQKEDELDVEKDIFEVLTYDILENHFEEYVDSCSSIKFISSSEYVSDPYVPYIEFKEDGTYLFYLVFPESVYELTGIWRKTQNYVMCELSRENAESLGIYTIDFKICDGYIEFATDGDWGWTKFGDTFWTEELLEKGKEFQSQRLHWSEMYGEYTQQVPKSYIPNVLFLSAYTYDYDPFISIASYRGSNDIYDEYVTPVSSDQLFYSNGGGWSFDIFIIDEYTLEIKNDTWNTGVEGIYKKSLN